MTVWQRFKQLLGLEQVSDESEEIPATPTVDVASENIASRLSPEEEAEAAAILHAFFEARDNWVCWCGEAIEEEEQVGRSVYYWPCGHRMGQGRARGKNPNLTTE